MVKSEISNIALIILAAGSSSRMGETKQLLPWKNTSLLQNIINVSKSSNAKDIYVVLGASQEIIRSSIEFNTSNIIFNPQWKSGLASSISVATSVLEESAYDGLLFVLADQPFVNMEFLNELIISFGEYSSKIIATKYRNSMGVPAVFPKKYFKELQLLNGEFGAKTLIKNYADECIAIVSKSVVNDIDTKQDYENFIQ